eukprot:scaffold134304_cov39-Prasinocladus_malaysianus.AAC.1
MAALVPLSSSSACSSVASRRGSAYVALQRAAAVPCPSVQVSPRVNPNLLRDPLAREDGKPAVASISKSYHEDVFRTILYMT